MAQPAHLEPVASGFTPHIHGPYRADLNIEQHFSRLLDLRLGCQRVYFEHVCPQFIRQLIAFFGHQWTHNNLVRVQFRSE